MSRRDDIDYRDACDWIWDAIHFNKDGPRCFEHLVCFLMMIEFSYDKASLTPRTRDGGVDVIFRKKGALGLAECKRHAANVGVAELRAIWGAKREYEQKNNEKVTELRFFATSEFSSGAQKFANDNRIVLCGRNDLVNLVFKHRVRLVFLFIEYGLPLASKHGMYCLRKEAEEDESAEDNDKKNNIVEKASENAKTTKIYADEIDSLEEKEAEEEDEHKDDEEEEEEEDDDDDQSNRKKKRKLDENPFRSKLQAQTKATPTSSALGIVKASLMDVSMLRPFFEARCITTDPHARSTSKELYQEYCDWCRSENFAHSRIASSTLFSLRVKAAGFDQWRSSRARGFIGITPIPKQEKKEFALLDFVRECCVWDPSWLDKPREVYNLLNRSTLENTLHDVYTIWCLKKKVDSRYILGLDLFLKQLDKAGIENYHYSNMRPVLLKKEWSDALQLRDHLKNEQKQRSERFSQMIHDAVCGSLETSEAE